MEYKYCEEILSNESYTGIPVRYNQFKYKWNDKNQIYKSKEKKNEEEWITISLPVIIDKFKFEQAQSIIKYNKVIPKKKHKGYENKFIAENVLKCGYCKAKISKQTTGTKKFIYYACPWKRASKKRLFVKNKNRCCLPFFDSDKVDTAIYNQIANLLVNPKEFTNEWLKDKPTEDSKEKALSLRQKCNLLEKKLKKAIQIEINAQNEQIEKIYRNEREKIEDEYNIISRQLTSAQNELLFHENKVAKLNQFQNIFQHPQREHTMRIKIALKRMLAKLSSEEKKKLINAVISPETGGCVYVRELSPRDLGLPSDDSNPNVTPPEHGNKVGERNFVIELDFTLEPSRIIEIIQSMDATVFKLGEQ